MTEAFARKDSEGAPITKRKLVTIIGQILDEIQALDLEDVKVDELLEKWDGILLNSYGYQRN